MLNIVLVEPEIPQNCGNIARTCAATGSQLHLIRPLGFDISEKAVRRAGLDYWNLVEVFDYENLEDFFRRRPEAERDLFLTGLQGLYGVIPELKSCRVLRGMEGSDYDAVLISEFENREALERYKNDPRHKAVSALCKSIRTDRAAVDCLLPD